MMLLIGTSWACAMVAAFYLLTLGTVGPIQRERLLRACAWLIGAWAVAVWAAVILLGRTLP